MRIGPLAIFEKTSSRRSFNIASWHSRHSLTWSWILSVSFDGTWRKPSGGLRIGVHPFRDNYGWQVVVALPFVVFHRHRQSEMWFRDMYRRCSDEREALESANRRLRLQMAEVRDLAKTPPMGSVQ